MFLSGWIGSSGAGGGGGVITPLPPGTVISPASLVAEYLIDQLVASSPANIPLIAWPIFVSSMPPAQVGGIPTDILATFDTSGINDGRSMRTKKVFDHEGVQIRFRARRYANGFAKARQARNAIDQAQGYLVTVDATTYRIDNLSRSGDITHIGPEPDTNLELFSLNLRTTLTLVP